MFAKQPDRFGIGHAIRQSQTRETHEGQTVVDQVICPFIGQVVQRLDDQDLNISTGSNGGRPLAPV